jgi:hypothetical protein
MSSAVVEIPIEVADQLARRALESGVSTSELATEAITSFLAQDPFEFIGSVSSETLRGRNVDQLLTESDFGR